MNISFYTIYETIGCGVHGTMGVRIQIASSRLDLTNRDFVVPPLLDSAAYDAAKLVQEELTAAVIAASPEVLARAAKERADLLALFPSPIFVETIPNGYCSSACCRHLPWFVVTTTVGRINLGWRKRVIAIDWSGTVGTKTSAELFAKEDVTKGERDIHAWSLDKAREYIAAIMESAAP